MQNNGLKSVRKSVFLYLIVPYGLIIVNFGKMDKNFKRSLLRFVKKANKSERNLFSPVRESSSGN